MNCRRKNQRKHTKTRIALYPQPNSNIYQTLQGFRIYSCYFLIVSNAFEFYEMSSKTPFKSYSVFNLFCLRFYCIIQKLTKQTII